MAPSSLSFVSKIFVIVTVIVALMLKQQPWHRTIDRSTLVSTRFGEWAVVVGASEGLGAAWADALCAHGLNVLMIARRGDVLKQQAQDILHRHTTTTTTTMGNTSSSSSVSLCHIETLVQDVRHFQKTKTILSRKFQDHTYGLLVWNAALNQPGYFMDSDIQFQWNIIDLSIQSVLGVTHAFLHHLLGHNHPNVEDQNKATMQKTTTMQQQQQTNHPKRPRRGGIVFMSSMAGIVGNAYIANYAATKAWTTVFAHGLAEELEPEGVRVLACLAGATLTPNYYRQLIPLSSSSSSSSNDSPPRNNDDWATQTPQQVVSECLEELITGQSPSIATGIVNKVARFVMTRFIPPATAIKFISQETKKRVLIPDRKSRRE